MFCGITLAFVVLHPQLKLKYFQQHRWEKEWIKTAEGIIRDEFDKYLGVSTSDSAPHTVSFSHRSCYLHRTYQV